MLFLYFIIFFTAFLAWQSEGPSHYLLLFGVELEALSEGTRLGLMVLLAVQVHALSIGDVLLLRVAKQTALETSITQNPQTLLGVYWHALIRFHPVS